MLYVRRLSGCQHMHCTIDQDCVLMLREIYHSRLMLQTLRHGHELIMQDDHKTNMTLGPRAEVNILGTFVQIEGM
jgi:hypothetical protein